MKMCIQELAERPFGKSHDSKPKPLVTIHYEGNEDPVEISEADMTALKMKIRSLPDKQQQSLYDWMFDVLDCRRFKS